MGKREGEKNDEGVKCSVCGSHSCENFAQAQQIEGAAMRKCWNMLHALFPDAFFASSAQLFSIYA